MELGLAYLRAGLGYACMLSNRAAAATGLACRRLMIELRQLNDVGANASSRRARVDAVKRKLAGRGEGPNRCC